MKLSYQEEIHPLPAQLAECGTNHNLCEPITLLEQLGVLLFISSIHFFSTALHPFTHQLVGGESPVQLMTSLPNGHFICQGKKKKKKLSTPALNYDIMMRSNHHNTPHNYHALSRFDESSTRSLLMWLRTNQKLSSH